MNREQFEHIEIKFREAAENFHPEVNSLGWEKMEALLDRHDDKRRPAGIWWYGLFLLLLSGGLGTYFYISRQASPAIMQHTSEDKEKPVARQGIDPSVATPPVTSKATQSPQAQPEKSQVDNSTNGNVHEPARKAAAVSTPAGTAGDDTRNALTLKQSRIKKAATSPVVKSKSYQFTERDLSTAADLRTVDEQRRRAGSYTGSNQQRRLAEEKATAKDDVAATKAQQTPPVTGKPADDTTRSKTVAKSDADQTKQQTKLQQPLKQEALNKTAQQQLPVNSLASRFYVTASVASDGNAVQGSAIKQVSAMYGIGLGYQFNNRFSIQTGLYAGSKKYDADSNSYYLKPGYWRMVRIRSIDADCFVFNVPVSVRYNIVPGRRGQLYGVAGVSSYFMQKETYDYYYSYPGSNVMQFRREVFGDNEHWFSVLDFSIGYEHRLSKHFSIQGEPYFKLPLKGVGEGKVHLYSGGFMLGLKFRP
jgi:hypothetical protein